MEWSKRYKAACHLLSRDKDKKQILQIQQYAANVSPENDQKLQDLKKKIINKAAKPKNKFMDFDALGNEVSTLINERMEAGSVLS